MGTDNVRQLRDCEPIQIVANYEFAMHRKQTWLVDHSFPHHSFSHHSFPNTYTENSNFFFTTQGSCAARSKLQSSAETGHTMNAVNTAAKSNVLIRTALLP